MATPPFEKRGCGDSHPPTSTFPGEPANGPEVYRSLYGDLTKLKDDSALKDPAAGSGDDDELFQLLITVPDWVDHYCNRHFYPRKQTLEFDGGDGGQLLVPDLISVTSLKEDSNSDLTFDTTWATTDYWLIAYNSEPTQFWGTPYNIIKAKAKDNKGAGFTEGERNFEITGT